MLRAQPSARSMPPRLTSRVPLCTRVLIGRHSTLQHSPSVRAESAQQIALEQGLRDLARMGRRSFAQVVRHLPDPIFFTAQVLAHAPRPHLVNARDIQRRRKLTFTPAVSDDHTPECREHKHHVATRDDTTQARPAECDCSAVSAPNWLSVAAMARGFPPPLASDKMSQRTLCNLGFEFVSNQPIYRERTTLPYR
jgi:hypothetical protein